MNKSVKILGLFLIGLFFASLVVNSIGVVSAEDPSQNNKIEGFLQKIVDLLEEKLNPSSESKGFYIFAKFLFILLIVLFVNSAIDLTGLAGSNKWASWVISLIFGILAFWRIEQKTIIGILTGYEAFGVAFSTFLPFIFLVVILLNLFEKNPRMARFLNVPLTIGFIVFLGWRWTIVWGKVGNFGWAYFITIVFSILWLFFAPFIMKQWDKEGHQQLIGDYKKLVGLASAKIRADASVVGGGDS